MIPWDTAFTGYTQIHNDSSHGYSQHGGIRMANINCRSVSTLTSTSFLPCYIKGTLLLTLALNIKVQNFLGILVKCTGLVITILVKRVAPCTSSIFWLFKMLLLNHG